MNYYSRQKIMQRIAKYRGPTNAEYINSMQLELISRVSDLSNELDSLNKLIDMQDADATTYDIYSGSVVAYSISKDSVDDINRDLAYMTNMINTNSRWCL